jgi:hypothetical protein
MTNEQQQSPIFRLDKLKKHLYNTIWGIKQLLTAVAEGTLLPLFKFRSMNGGIVFKNGSPLGWLGKHQEHTSLSSCKAEICATNATSKKVVDFQNLSRSVSESSHKIEGVSSPMLLYNDNDACAKWSHNMTSKVARHIKLHENSIWEWVQDKTLNVVHVAGKVNPADIFTKEMKGGTHFCRLRDSFMIRFSDFMNDSLLHLHHACQQIPQVTPAATLVRIASGCTPYIAALASNSFCCTLSNVTHLCSAGWHLFQKHHHMVPSGLL